MKVSSAIPERHQRTEITSDIVPQRKGIINDPVGGLVGLRNELYLLNRVLTCRDILKM